MTYREFYTAVDAAIAKIEASGKTYYAVGVRFEDKLRRKGCLCNRSRHNRHREDEREYPEYGTTEYRRMSTLAGSSAWEMPVNCGYESPARQNPALRPVWGKTEDCEMYVMADHCYIVAGDDTCTPGDADEGETVIMGARVVEVIF